MKPRNSFFICWKVSLFVTSTALCAMLVSACGKANKNSQSAEAETIENSTNQGQEAESVKVELDENIILKDDKDTLTVAPKMPQFPGGLKALMEYFDNNRKYPEEAQRKGIQGRVIVQFVVGKDGSVIRPCVKRGIDSLIDQEALRLIRSMPKWIPGELKDGTKVCVRYTVPISFKLQNPATDSSADKQASIERDKEAINKAVAEGLEIVSKKQTNVVTPIFPQFPGGQKALVKYLRKNIKYPDEALMRGLEGRVVVGFVVEKNGRINQCRVMSTTDSIFNTEAIRVVSAMPRWKPGELKDGRKINVFYRLPITFIPRPTEKEGNATAKT